jgi:hypothetical protein
MSSTPRRFLCRGMLLAFGIAAIWLIGALIGPASSSASSPSASANPAAPPNPFAPLIDPLTDPVTQTVNSVLPSAQALISSITTPVLGPVVSPLGGTPLGGVLSPPPVPIQVPPVTTLVTGVLSVGSSAPLVGEPIGAGPASQPQLAGPQPAASSPTEPGSVPAPPAPTPSPFPVPVPATPAAPAAPTTPFAPALPAPTGPGSPNGAGPQIRAGIDTEVPTPSPASHPTASRAPPGVDSSIRRLIADEPSFSPD